MSKNTSNRSGANDGTWFLEAIGTNPKAPTPSEIVAELEAENTIISESPGVSIALDDPQTTVESSSFDGDPGTSTSSFDPAPAIPPLPQDVAQEVDTEDSVDTARVSADDPEEDVDHTDVSRALRSRRTFRWPVVVLLVLLIAAVGIAAAWLPAAAEDEAMAARQAYYDAAFGVRDYLPTTQIALDAITNPESSPDQVSGAVPVIAEFDTKAFALETVTSEPLPSVFPLVPSGAIEALDPLKDAGAILGAASSELARRLGNAYVYRTSIPLLLDTGSLPISATTQEINEISVELASSLASDAAIVADLPDDPAFIQVKATAVEALDRSAQWQDAYLGALTGEDTETASTLVAEVDGITKDLADTNRAALLAFRTEADLGIVELAGNLDQYLIAVSQN